MRVTMKEEFDKSTSNSAGGAFGSIRQPFGGGRGSSERDPTFGRNEIRSLQAKAAPTFSVTMSGIEPSKREKLSSGAGASKKAMLKNKGTNGANNGTKVKVKAVKPKPLKAVKETVPTPTVESMDEDMDAYFASRPAKEDA